LIFQDYGTDLAVTLGAMRVCLMIEGQEDVTWDQWLEIARACEDSGLEGLFRSDHYLSVMGRSERGSLDAWTTLAGLAAVTERIKLGTLVSPASFRHPSVLAKSAVTVDHISNGRVELGLGAGWLRAEHEAYGFPFHDTRTRIDVFAEQLEIVHRSWTEEGFDLAGEHYEISSLNALPEPVQRPHPNLIVGGSGGPRSSALAARWADEYNTVHPNLEDCNRRRAAVAAACERAGREMLVFSVMTGCVVGKDDNEVERRAQAVMGVDGGSGSVRRWLESVADEWVVGTVDQVMDRLGELGDAGVERVMLQHLAHWDTDMIRTLGEEVARAVA
jgi:F420-dependent oxidoreductase-like protein